MRHCRLVELGWGAKLGRMPITLVASSKETAGWDLFVSSVLLGRSAAGRQCRWSQRLACSSIR